ncbi:hypothetical protein J7E62_08185 [Variovorax paradoxus]|nr:hypothetical protein [Variovorax paradoxus]
MLELFGIQEIGRFEVAQPVMFDEDLRGISARSQTPAPFLGVIDDFVGFLHPELAARFQAVWSQDLSSPNASGMHWKRSDDMGYGFEYQQPEIGPPIAREVYPPVLRRVTHRSHITSLAAGEYVRPDAADMEKGRRPFTDMVSRVKLIGVHLPLGTVVDTSGGSMSAQVIDGLRFIIHRAGESSFGAVNISYATHAGPHDGQSILEHAIDELVRLRDGHLAVVFPVGNHYESRCHARFRLAPTEVRLLQWHILPDSATASFLEIWLPPGAENQIGVRVENPSGEKSDLVQVGKLWVTTDPAIGCFAVIFPMQVANSDSERGTMAFVAVAPTRPKASTGAIAMHGVWLVEVHNCSAQAVEEIDAWIERNDSLFGRRVRGRQSYFVDPDYELNGRRPTPPEDNASSHVKREGSFSTFATGVETIAVGGYAGCRHKTSRVADYSAGGWALTRRNWMANYGPLGTGEILYKLSQAAAVPLLVGPVQPGNPQVPTIPGVDPGNARRVGFGELPFPTDPSPPT